MEAPRTGLRDAQTGTLHSAPAATRASCPCALRKDRLCRIVDPAQHASFHELPARRILWTEWDARTLSAALPDPANSDPQSLSDRAGCCQPWCHGSIVEWFCDGFRGAPPQPDVDAGHLRPEKNSSRTDA